MQVTASAIQYSTKKAQVMQLAFELTSTFPGTDVLFLIFSEENPIIYDFRTPRFASMITHPESKQLIIEYISAPDAESPDDNGTPDHDKADDGDTQDEVPKFKFRREGNGTMVIVDKEQHDLMFPQFKAHAMRKFDKAGRTDAHHHYSPLPQPSTIPQFKAPALGKVTRDLDKLSSGSLHDHCKDLYHQLT
ncbi:hypothetical protein KVV02_004243 [Mortierella alpina]|uniref:Uncharacterized protein n=1 Tax=Mortierella alpina TaxID=64518 RepID=A0A9P8CWH8_MORAP|nr:hypothetical protein KVV02_004243 [Mortierella alpina]